MKTIKLYCKVCNVKLTDQLEEIHESALVFNDGETVIAKNKFSIHTENGSKEIVVAIDTYFLENHTDRLRFTGCCGSSGLDSMNKTCMNGHEVATEVSDCYTPHYISFNLKKVIIKEVTDDYNLKTIII
ncbi:hypothetical protein [Flavobacterium sp.]|uniref:hypothetical protein n=1 Tax=Flavobacterium sp. TaxID=239 RepID=UPI003266F1AA